MSTKKAKEFIEETKLFNFLKKHKTGKEAEERDKQLKEIRAKRIAKEIEEDEKPKMTKIQVKKLINKVANDEEITERRKEILLELISDGELDEAIKYLIDKGFTKN
jgi:hypothetical protein